MNECILEVKDVSKCYGTKRILNHVSFTCKKGGIIGLLGPNGSGKTTLIKMITGLITAYDGEIMVNKTPISDKTKAMVSYLSDEPYFADWMKVKDGLKIFTDMYRDFDLARCLQMLQKFHIEENMRIKTMSKGTKEKFQLALVMSRNASLIVLDEPIGGVDPVAREVILDTILNNYHEEQTILIATHLIADIERIFDSVLFLKEGNIILNEDVEELRMKTNCSIDELFKEKFRYE